MPYRFTKYLWRAQWLNWNFHMTAVRRKLYIRFVYGTISMLLLLSACSALAPVLPAAELVGVTPTQINTFCDACDQATLVVALTQEKKNTDNQAAATAEIERANAQATLNSANATVNAAQTQDQNNANAIAAQIAATAEIERANAQATLNSAGATQSIALTQDAIRQTQMADLATSNAQAIMVQQNKDELAAGTQTAVANNIATQTQVAAATSQWYADQGRQRAEQRQGPILFLWTLCLPIFVVILAGLVLWGFWRWLRIQQANQRILVNPVERLQPPRVEVIEHSQNDSLPYLESDLTGSRHPLTKPDDQVRRWLDEVKRKLRSSDEKDEDDNTEK
jgi:hypothetical protein